MRNALVLGREDTRTQTRDWLVANVPQGTKVAFEPIAPTEWYGVTPGGGPKADPAPAVGALQPQPGDHRRARAATSAARATRRTSRTTSARSTPELIDVYRREGVCWVVTGSTQYGRARAEP